VSLETITSGSLSYSVEFDEPQRVCSALWAIVSGYVIDELTGAAPEAPLSITVLQPGLIVNVNADGSFAIAAHPWQRFPPLLAASYPLTVTVSAVGYIPVTITTNVSTLQRHIAGANVASGATQITLDDASGIGDGTLLLLGRPPPPKLHVERAIVAYPGPGANQLTLRSPLQHGRSIGDPVVADEYATTSLGTIPLRRTPVRYSGRTFTRDDSTNTTTAVANATITVTDFWRTVASTTSPNGVMTNPIVAARAVMLAAQPGAHTSHASAAPVAPVTLASAAADDKLLLDAAPAGATVIHVSNRVNLGAGDVLIIDCDAGDAAEPIAVVSISGWGNTATDGWVTLANALARNHRSGVRIERGPAPVPGAAQTLKDGVAPGDVTLFVDAIGALTSTGWVTVNGVGQEYQGTQPVAAQSDSNGYFELPPLHRVAALQLQAAAPGKTAVTLTVQPDYASTQNRIELVFT
jgi:hypothetical protein